MQATEAKAAGGKEETSMEPREGAQQEAREGGGNNVTNGEGVAAQDAEGLELKDTDTKVSANAMMGRVHGCTRGSVHSETLPPAGYRQIWLRTCRGVAALRFPRTGHSTSRAPCQEFFAGLEV